MFGKKEGEAPKRQLTVIIDEEVAEILHMMYPTDQEKSNFLAYTVLKKAMWLKKRELEGLYNKMEFYVQDERLKDEKEGTDNDG
jgi:hypothetical protein